MNTFSLRSYEKVQVYIDTHELSVGQIARLLEVAEKADGILVYVPNERVKRTVKNLAEKLGLNAKIEIVYPIERLLNRYADYSVKLKRWQGKQEKTAIPCFQRA